MAAGLRSEVKRTDEYPGEMNGPPGRGWKAVDGDAGVVGKGMRGRGRRPGEGGGRGERPAK